MRKLFGVLILLLALIGVTSASTPIVDFVKKDTIEGPALPLVDGTQFVSEQCALIGMKAHTEDGTKIDRMVMIITKDVPAKPNKGNRFQLMDTGGWSGSGFGGPYLAWWPCVKVAIGSYTVTGTATDADGHVGASQLKLNIVESI